MDDGQNRKEHLTQELLSNAHADKIQAAFDKITKHPFADYLCLYGAGAAGLHIYKTMTEHGINVDFFAESDAGAHVGTCIDGKPVISFSELTERKEKTLVLIGLGAGYEIWKRLLACGFPYVDFIGVWQIEHLQLMKQQFTAKMLPTKLDKLCSVCTDKDSFEIALIWLNEMLKMDFDFERIQGICTPEWYYPTNIFAGADGEVIVDVGAFDGDTVKRFANEVPSYGAIHAIEMSGSNYSKLLENTKAYRNIKCYNIGVSDTCGEAVFTESDSGSRLQEDKLAGGETVKIVTLDSLLSEERVDYIKMDIEGAELAALKGAERTIREQKPKCAISVYHNPEHLFEVPFLLKQLVPEYKIYFRHHTALLYETVCYATL
jgi:FkbM family methyltransferase